MLELNIIDPILGDVFRTGVGALGRTVLRLKPAQTTGIKVELVFASDKEAVAWLKGAVEEIERPIKGAEIR